MDLEEKIFSGIYDSLKPGGCLVIETPNYECNYAKSFKGDWRSLELPRHLVIFSPKSIYRILKDSGFEVNVLVRVSPIDVKESFKLRYKSKSNKNRIKKFLSLCKIIMFQKRNSSLLVVVAKKL